jgi:hypothetical protein
VSADPALPHSHISFKGNSYKATNISHLPSTNNININYRRQQHRHHHHKNNGNDNDNRGSRHICVLSPRYVFFFPFSYSTYNYLQIDYAFGTATKPGTTNGYHQSATTATIPGRQTATTTTSIITTTTSMTATTMTTSTTTTRRRRRATMATEARDAYTSRASGTIVCLIFLIFRIFLLIFFTD